MSAEDMSADMSGDPEQASVGPGTFAPSKPFVWLQKHLGPLRLATSLQEHEPSTSMAFASAFMGEVMAQAIVSWQPSGKPDGAEAARRKALTAAAIMSEEPHVALRRYLLGLLAANCIERKVFADNVLAWKLADAPGRGNVASGWPLDGDSERRKPFADAILAHVLALEPECIYHSERKSFAIRMLKEPAPQALRAIWSHPVWQEPMAGACFAVTKAPHRFEPTAVALASEWQMGQRIDAGMASRRERSPGL